MVVDKPAGLVVHHGAGHHGGTLVDGLLARFPDLVDLADAGGGDPGRPGIVHRLDKGTSGLLVVARTPERLPLAVQAVPRTPRGTRVPRARGRDRGGRRGNHRRAHRALDPAADPHGRHGPRQTGPHRVPGGRALHRPRPVHLARGAPGHGPHPSGAGAPGRHRPPGHRRRPLRRPRRPTSPGHGQDGAGTAVPPRLPLVARPPRGGRRTWEAPCPTISPGCSPACRPEQADQAAWWAASTSASVASCCSARASAWRARRTPMPRRDAVACSDVGVPSSSP